jgi:hypothetical protein
MVEVLVVLYEVGPVLAQPFHEDAAHLAAQVQPDAADPGRTGLRRRLDDLVHLPRVVIDARHQGRDQHAGRDPRAVELGHGLKPRAWVRRVGLARPPRLLVDGGDRQVRAEIGNLRDLLHQVEIAQQQRRLGQHRAWVRRVAHRLPDAAHELVAPLDPLVRIGVRAQRDVLVVPRLPRQFDPQDLRDVDLDNDLALEVAPGVEVEVRVGWAGKAVVADDSVGDEVARAGRDVVDTHRHAEVLDCRDVELRV